MNTSITPKVGWCDQVGSEVVTESRVVIWAALLQALQCPRRDAADNATAGRPVITIRQWHRRWIFQNIPSPFVLQNVAKWCEIFTRQHARPLVDKARDPGGALPHSGWALICACVSRRDFLINSVPGIVITQINTGPAGEGSCSLGTITTLLLGTERERKVRVKCVNTDWRGRDKMMRTDLFR